MIWIIDDDAEFAQIVERQLINSFRLCHKRASGTFDDAEFAQTVERQPISSFRLCHKRATGTFDGAEGSDNLKELISCRSVSEKLQIRHFTNAIEAISCQEVPDLIFLDILLDGPDGFTFLNELRSYEDLSKVPVVIMSSLNFRNKDLGAYGVVGYLNKSEMTPMDVMGYVRKYARSKD